MSIGKDENCKDDDDVMYIYKLCMYLGHITYWAWTTLIQILSPSFQIFILSWFLLFTEASLYLYLRMKTILECPR